MRTILHIITRPHDDLASRVIEEQRRMADTTVDIVTLAGTEADYSALVERIFTADSVEVW